MLRLCMLVFLLSQSLLLAKSKSLLVICDFSPKIVEMNKDGFVGAMELLKQDYNVDYYNLNLGGKNPKFEAYDAIFVKSNWGCAPDLYARKHIPPNLPKALLISGVNPVPSREAMFFYDVLFYETEWYRPQIQDHPCIIHAFGTNTSVMKPAEHQCEKIYDYIMVGEFKPEKRFEKFVEKEGRKLCVGLIYDPKNPIVLMLRKHNVEIHNYVSYEKLAEMYHSSRCCYQPCQIDGGGERAILEARACGIFVETSADNPKLLELTTCPLYDHVYYYEQLKLGMEHIFEKKVYNENR